MAKDTQADVELDEEQAGSDQIRHLYGDSNGVAARRPQRDGTGVTGVHRKMDGPVPVPYRNLCCQADTLDDPNRLPAM